MKEDFAAYFTEAIKYLSAAFGGSLSTYLTIKQKEKREKAAEQFANSDYWRNEVKNIKEYTDERIAEIKKDSSEKIGELLDELKKCKEQYLKQ